MVNRVLFSSAKEHWATPPELYESLNTEFRFDLDPCPLDAATDGLSPLFCEWTGRRVFCNPPYGPGIGNWLSRAQEADVAVFLLPSRTDTRWFHELVLPHAREIRFCRGRLRFGNSPNPAPFSSLIAVYAKD